MPERYVSRTPVEIDLGGGQKGWTNVSISVSNNRHFGQDRIISDISSDTIYLLNPNRDLRPILVRTPSVHNSEPRTVWSSRLTTDKFIVLYKVTLDFDAVENGKGILSEDLMYNFETGEVNRVSFVDENMTSREWVPSGTLSPEIPRNMDAGMISAIRLKEAEEQNKLKGELKKLAAEMDIEDNPVVRIIKFK